MRKIALCLLVLLLPVITVMAQLMPIMEEGKEWVIHTQVVAPFTPVYIYKMKIEGDTVVGATLCKKLHTTKMDASGNILYRSTSYCQQHGDKFYKGNNIMFDMGLEEGGIYRYISPEDYIVTSVRDTVLADGKKRKCMDLNLYYTDGESGEKKIAPVVSDIWVEGIGSLTMGIYENRAELLGQRIELQSVSVNGEYIYQKDSQKRLLMPIMEEGKEWVIHTQGTSFDAPVYIYKMKIEGDTLVSGTTGKKLHTIKMDANGDILESQVSYCKQDGGRFYKGRTLMFDLSMNKGDIFPYMEDIGDYIVTNVYDTAFDDGIRRKCLEISHCYTDNESGEKHIGPVMDQWVEGIGSLRMGIYSNNCFLMGTRRELQSVSVNGEYIYQVEPKDTFPGNPIINKAYFTPSEPTTDDEVTFNVELGVFEGNITYNHQVESITGDTINIRASYDKDYGVISVSSLDKPLSLGKLKEGNYEVRYTIKACSGENPTGEEWPFTYRLKVKKAGESIPDTPVQPDTIPADTGQVMPPVVTPDKPDVYVPVIREDDNVTEYPHNPVGGKAEQGFVMSLEGEYLRIKGTLKARGYDKHYIHCQIIGDSVHLQRYDMDPESTDMILHHVDIRIPGFTGNYYHVTLAEQNDIPLYKPYMAASRAVTRNLNGMDDAATALPAFSVQATGSAILCTATDAMKLEVYTMDAVKVGETLFANGTATVKVSKAPAIYLYIVTYRDGRRESGKVVVSK